MFYRMPGPLAKRLAIKFGRLINSDLGRERTDELVARAYSPEGASHLDQGCDRRRLCRVGC